jgi:RNA polymerase sigma factor (sigma-70 family)
VLVVGADHRADAHGVSAASKRDCWVPEVELNQKSNLADSRALDPGFAGAAVAKALGVLTDQQREVVALRYFHEKSHREIAQLLGKREGAVRVTLLRALRGLRKALPELVL